MFLWVSCKVTKPDYIKGKTVDIPMSPAPASGPDLRPTPVLRQERRVQRGEGEENRRGQGQVWGDKPARSTEAPVVRDRASFSVVTGQSHRPEQGITPSSPLSSFYRRTQAYGDFPTIRLGLQ